MSSQNIQSQHAVSDDQSGHKYTFQLQLIKLYCSINFTCQVKLIWARGLQQIQNQNPIHTQPNSQSGEIPLSQTYCNKSTVVFNRKTRQFKKKESKIMMKLIAKGAQKNVGEYVINLCQILDPFSIKSTRSKQYRVKLNTDKFPCQLAFRLTAEHLQEMTCQNSKDQRSVGSGIASLSSKTGGITPTTNKLSSAANEIFSTNTIGVQKKNVFLYEAPSKDNQSVTSYTSYNTGMVRHSSGLNRRQSTNKAGSNNGHNTDTDTLSVRREQYGIQQQPARRQTAADFFANNNPRKSNITSQDFGDVKSRQDFGNGDARSRQGSYNRFTTTNSNNNLNMNQQHNHNNYENKTENFDQISTNKQLFDQQSKRSKLQAELSKMEIYKKEQTRKLNQYIVENTKLKEQISRLNSSHEQAQHTRLSSENEQVQRLKKQNNDLHDRTYELDSETRDLRRDCESLVKERNTLRDQLRRIQLDKERAEGRVQSLSRNLQLVSTSNNKQQQFLKQIQNLQDQLEHVKSLNVSLRENLEKERKRTEDLDYSNRSFAEQQAHKYKEKQQRLSEIDRQYNSILSQLRDRDAELNAKKELVYRLEKTNDEYKSKILASQGEKNSLLQQNMSAKSESQKLKKELSYLKQDLLKLRDQKSAEFQHRNGQLQTINSQNTNKIRSLQYEVQQSRSNYRQISTMNDTLKKDLQDRKNENYRLQSNIKTLRQFQNKFLTLERVMAQKDKQISYAKQQNNKLIYNMSELESRNKQLEREYQQTKVKAKQCSNNNVDVNQILRESVQMQVQLKFKSDELLRLKNIQEQYEETKYRLQIEQKNRSELESETDKIEKQLKDKNKLYLIEVEKGKIVNQEKFAIERELQISSSELKRCQQIIFNGDKQVKDMEAHIHYLQGQARVHKEKLDQSQKELARVKIQAADTSRFEDKINDFEKDLNQKIQTIKYLTANLSNSQKQARQLQAQVRYKDDQLIKKTKLSEQSSKKTLQIEQSYNRLNSEVQKITSEKNGLKQMNETIMQEIHDWKKKFQQQKGRSTSFARSNEEQTKIRDLQNQLEKKQKVISKLTKEKLQIEQENINLHVQVMKKLSQMEKTKDNSSQNITSTERILYTPGSSENTSK